MENIYNNIDLFGVNHSWKFLSKEKHYSKISLYLSFILILILMFKVLRMVYKLYIIRSEYNIRSVSITDPNLEIDITDMGFAVCMMDENFFNEIEWKIGYELDFFHYRGKKDYTSNTITHSKCDSSYTKEFFDLDYPLGNCICYKSRNATLNDNLFNGNYQAIELSLRSKRDNDEEIYLGIYITDFYFDYTYYPYPFRKTYNFLYFAINSNNYMENQRFVNKISYDDTSFDYEFNKYEGFPKESFSISDKSNYYHNTKRFNGYSFCLILFSGKKNFFNEINIFSFDYILATSGGIFQFLYMIFKFICSYINENLLNKVKINLLKEQYINRIKSNISNLDSSRNELSFSNYNYSKKINKSQILYDKVIEKELEIYDFEAFTNIYYDVMIIKKLLFNNQTLKLFDVYKSIERVNINEIKYLDKHLGMNIENYSEKKLNYLIKSYYNK